MNVSHIFQKNMDRSIKAILKYQCWLQNPIFVFFWYYKNLKIIKITLYICDFFLHILLRVFEFRARTARKCHLKHLHHSIIIFDSMQDNASENIYLSISYSYYFNAILTDEFYSEPLNVLTFGYLVLFMCIYIKCMSTFNSNKMGWILSKCSII